jgi:hypothetical protein
VFEWSDIVGNPQLLTLPIARHGEWRSNGAWSDSNDHNHLTHMVRNNYLTGSVAIISQSP